MLSDSHILWSKIEKRCNVHGNVYIPIKSSTLWPKPFVCHFLICHFLLRAECSTSLQLLAWAWLALSFASLRALLASSSSSTRDLVLLAERWALEMSHRQFYNSKSSELPCLAIMDPYNVPPYQNNILLHPHRQYLASLALSSVISTVSCRLVSSP